MEVDSIIPSPDELNPLAAKMGAIASAVIVVSLCFLSVILQIMLILTIHRDTKFRTHLLIKTACVISIMEIIQNLTIICGTFFTLEKHVERSTIGQIIGGISEGCVCTRFALILITIVIILKTIEDETTREMQRFTKLIRCFDYLSIIFVLIFAGFIIFVVPTGLVETSFNNDMSKWNLAYGDRFWGCLIKDFRDGLRIFFIIVVGVHFIGLAAYMYHKERTIYLFRVSIDASRLIESVLYFLVILGLMLLRIGVASSFIQTTAWLASCNCHFMVYLAFNRSVRKQLLYQCTHCRSSPPTILTSVVPVFREPPRSILLNPPKSNQTVVPTATSPPIPEQNNEFLTVPPRTTRAVRFQDAIQQIG